METVISVQDAMAELKVNRASFYARCKKSGIKPTRQGRRSFITNEDLECLASVCMESVCQTSGSDRQQIDNRQTADRQTDTSDKSSSSDLRLIEALNTEITHLKTMLSEERMTTAKEKRRGGQGARELPENADVSSARQSASPPAVTRSSEAVQV